MDSFYILAFAIMSCVATISTFLYVLSHYQYRHLAKEYDQMFLCYHQTRNNIKNTHDTIREQGIDEPASTVMARTSASLTNLSGTRIMEEESAALLRMMAAIHRAKKSA